MTWVTALAGEFFPLVFYLALTPESFLCFSHFISLFSVHNWEEGVALRVSWQTCEGHRITSRKSILSITSGSQNGIQMVRHRLLGEPSHQPII